MVRFDIITLTSPMMTRTELQQLCDEISRLRSACERLADEIDVATARKLITLQLLHEMSYKTFLISAPRSPAVTSPSRAHRPPPPIPAALRCLSLQQSPFHTQLPPIDNQQRMFPPAQPPSYNDVMRESGRPHVTSSLPNLVEDDNGGEWSCSMCTFLNYPLLNHCE